MAYHTTVIVLLTFSILFFKTAMVHSATFDKKTIESMVLKTLWNKVFAGYDPKGKEAGIKLLRGTGDYDKLINQLVKVKKEKARRC